MSPTHSGKFELYTEVAAPADLRVLEWSLTETVCAPYRLELRASCPLGAAEELAERLLGQRAAFAIHGAVAGSHARRGIIVESRVEGGLDSERASLAVVLAPRLGLCELRVHSRIFQDMSAPEILAAVLGEWQLEHAFQLSGSYPKRPYTTQYRETDLAFITRLCGREGLGFFLEQRPLEPEEATQPGSEKLIFVDDAGLYPTIAAPAEGNTGSTLVHWTERFDALEHHVSGFGVGRAVRPELVRLADVDFTRPALPLSAVASLAKDDRSPIGDALGGERLAVYLHGQRAELGGNGSELSDAFAKVRLEQLRQNAAVGRGTSRCQRLFPGARFTLEGHPVGGLNKDYVVTRVEHRGRIPEADGATAEDVYTNRFECVPAGVLCRAPLSPLRVQQAIETATVVGPKGEELHCDEHGRVKVQFHWDLEGNRDETSSCWLRVAQQWAGTGFGSQFIPRVGSDVLVGFLGGDVDRPVVVGSLYNGARPFPFRLPLESSKSGFRTQSSPGGEGFSELTFDDTKGRERLFVRAQKDFEQVVENNYALTVKSSENVHVEGTSTRTVTGDATQTVLGETTELFDKSLQVTVKGSHALAVDGDTDVRVSGMRMTRVDGREQAELFSEARATYHQDQVVRVLGHLVTVVGQDDARRSATLHVEGSSIQHSSGTTEISSEKEIVLRVGQSAIRLSDEGVELVTKKIVLHAEDLQLEAKDKLAFFAKKQVALCAENIDAIAEKRVVLKGEQGQLQLDKNGRLDGQLVKLNCQPDPIEEGEAPQYEPPKPTIIKLTDEEGKPIPGRRYVITLADGSERSGMLDENGEAELYLEESGEISFPDVDNPRLY